MKRLPTYFQFINEHYSLLEKKNVSKSEWRKTKVTDKEKESAGYTRSSPSRKVVLNWDEEDLTDDNGKDIPGKRDLQKLIKNIFTETFGDEVKLANKMFSPSQMGGKPRDAKIEVGDNGKSVTVDGLKMSKIDKPFDKDTSDPDEQRINEAIDKHNRLIDRYANAKDLKFVEPAPGLNAKFKEIDRKDISDEKKQEARADVICEAVPKHISSKMRDELTKGGRKITDDEEAIIKKWESLSEIKDPDEFEKASLNALTSMTADGDPPAPESMRLAAADLTETVVYMNLNRKGTKCELPDSANYPVADIIAFPDPSKLKELESGKLSPKELVEGGYVVSLEDAGGQSVKKDGGAASGATEKLKLSSFKGDPETNQELGKILDNFDNFNGVANTDKLDKASDSYEKSLDWAKSKGFVDNKWKPKISESGNGSDIKKWVPAQMRKLKKKGTPNSNAERIFESWFKDCALLAEIHNKSVKSQDYGNVNVKTGKNADMEITDGIETLSHMKPSMGWKAKELKDKTYIPKPRGIHQAQLKHKEKK